MLHLKGRGFNKFVHTIEFETLADDGVPDTGRRHNITDAIAPDMPEGSIFFRSVYDLLNMPVDECFHACHADLKALAYLTGSCH